MKNIPKIILEENIDLDRETNLFLSFLHHPYYIQNRSFIFQIFPELKRLLEKQDEKKQIIKSFISKLYSDNKKEIRKIIQKNKNLLKKKSKPSLMALLEIMDYQYDKPIVYKAIPTILPFSPFEDDVFYFSILGEIKDRADKNILTIGIHEISHFILFNQLKKIEKTKDLILPDDLKNYLKETLAVVILNQKSLCDILDLKNYKGNPEIQNLRIEELDSSIKTLTDFLNEYYYAIKIKEQKSFSIFLEKIINILLPITSEFIKKRMIWNKYGKKVLREPKIIKLYSESIKIKKGQS